MQKKGRKLTREEKHKGFDQRTNSKTGMQTPIRNGRTEKGHLDPEIGRSMIETQMYETCKIHLSMGNSW